MAESRIIRLVIQAVDQASAAIHGVEAKVKGFGDRVGAIFKGLGSLIAAAAIGKFIKDSFDQALEAERGMQRLGQAVQNAGGDFTALRSPLDQAVDGVRRLSNFTQSELLEALTRMITVTGDVGGSTKNLALVADLASARHLDLAAAADLVGKAMDGNVAPLKKIGIEGSTSAEAIANLHAAVDGFASQSIDPIQQVTHQFEDLEQSVGQAILSGEAARGSFGSISQALADLGGWVDHNRDLISALTDTVVALATGLGSILGSAVRALMPILLAFLHTIGFALEGLGMLGTVAANTLDKIGIHLDTGLAGTLSKAGANIQRATEDAYARLAVSSREGETRMTATVADGTTRRRRLTQDEADGRTKIQKDQARELEKVNHDLAVKLLQLEKGWTKDQADEFVRRQEILTGKQTETVDDLAEGYDRIDQLNLELAAGFDEEVKPAVKDTTIHLGELRDTTDPLGEKLQELATKAGDAAGATQDLSDHAAGLPDAVRDGVGAVGDLGEQFGFLSDDAHDALDDVTSLADQLLRFGSDPAGNITALIGAVGSFGGLLKGLFGDGGAAARRVIDANTEAIRANTTRVGDLLRIQTPGNQFAGFQQTVSAFLSTASTAGLRPGAPGGAQLLQQFIQQLAAAGLSFTDLADLAKTLDIELDFSSPGRFLGSLRALQSAIGTSEPTRFGQDFESQFRRIGQGVNLGAIGTGDQFGAFAGLASTFGASGLTDILNQFDVTQAAGRDAALEAFRDLFNQLNEGTLAPEALGGLNGEQFLELLSQLITLLQDPDQVIAGFQLPVTPDTPAIETSITDGFAGLTEPIGQSVDYLASIDTTLQKMALSLFPAGGSGPNPGAGRGPGGVTVSAPVGDIHVHVEGGAGATADAIGDAVRHQLLGPNSVLVQAIDQALVDRLAGAQLARGSAQR